MIITDVYTVYHSNLNIQHSKQVFAQYWLRFKECVLYAEMPS